MLYTGTHDKGKGDIDSQFELFQGRQLVEFSSNLLDIEIFSSQTNLEVHVFLEGGRPHFRFGSEIWNWSENFVSLRSEKKAWFHMIHFGAKHQKSEVKTKVK